METRYSIHPSHFKHLTTSEIRDNFLIETLFLDDKVELVYTHEDRMIIGGIKPVTTSLCLDASTEINAEYFLERRELGIINIGGAGSVALDGELYDIAHKDGIYVGAGTKKLVFSSKDGNDSPAEFYVISCPAHTSYPTVKIHFEQAQPVHLGDEKSLNKRTIYQYVHPKICKSCQLLMGLTMLYDGNVWNTMPCHIHDRRMEAYMYFNFSNEDNRVFHFMGEPDETRHIVVQEKQALISPPWSIHSGVATGTYTFIWAMGGENQTFTDMDMIDMKSLR